jgi:hypothetical protein
MFDIIDIIKCFSFWKDADNVKTDWISHDYDYHFVLIKSGLIKSQETLPVVILNRRYDSREFVWNMYSCCQLCLVQFVGIQRRCLTTKPIEFVNHQWTMDSGIHVHFDKSRANKNSHSSSTAKIAWSIIFGPSISGLSSFPAVHLVSFRYCDRVEYSMASGPMTATNYSWMAEAENNCLRRNM